MGKGPLSFHFLVVKFFLFFTFRTEQGLELDLFLMQCCAALAPPDLYVKRIVERFGLLNYISLTLERSNEYVFTPFNF